MGLKTILQRASLTGDNDVIELHNVRTSLDRLADDIIDAQNRLVARQAEIHKAEMELEECQDAFCAAVAARLPCLQKIEEHSNPSLP